MNQERQSNGTGNFPVRQNLLGQSTSSLDGTISNMTAEVNDDQSIKLGRGRRGGRKGKEKGKQKREKDEEEEEEKK